MDHRWVVIVLLAAAGPVHADEDARVEVAAFTWPSSIADCDDGRRLPGWPMGECLKAGEAREIFRKLLRVGRGLPEYRSDWQEPKLFFEDTDEMGANYYWEARVLGLNRGSLWKSDKLTWVALSHEVAHWIQEMQGVQLFVMKNKRSIYGLWKRNRYSSQQLEAQADLSGLRLAVLAGFPKQEWRDGLAQLWGCDNIGDIEPQRRHPSPGDRYSNLFRAPEKWTLARRSDIKADAVSIESMDALDLFRSNGALADQEPLTPERARELCRGLFDGLDEEWEMAAGREAIHNRRSGETGAFKNVSAFFYSASFDDIAR